MNNYEIKNAINNNINGCICSDVYLERVSNRWIIKITNDSGWSKDIYISPDSNIDNIISAINRKL